MHRAALAGAAAVAALAAAEVFVFPTLQTTIRMGLQPAGFTLLSTNQLLRPWGERLAIPGRPVDLALRGNILAVLNWRNVLLYDAATGAQLADVPTRATSYAGIAFRPGAGELWASETGRSDSIFILQVDEAGRPGATERIELPDHPVPTGVAFSADGRTAYVALSRRNALGIINAETRALEREVPVGMAPFGVAASAKYGRVFVSNRGGRRPSSGDTTAPSSGSDIVTDPRTGSAATGTLSVIDAKSLEVREVAVGLAPSGVALSADEDTLAVANGHSDSVSLIDTRTLRRTDVNLPAFPEGSFGSQPVAAAFDKDSLYVACGGNNAVAVLRRGKLAGWLPAAWFPSAVAVDARGALRIVAIKGVGNTAAPGGGFNSRTYEGSLERITAPASPRLTAATREVRAANSPRFEPAGGVANPASLGIRHVFLIIKENRTYDQVFGDMPRGNGEPQFAIYGRGVTPNHRALAERYVLLDNFYTGGAVSFDGHHWLMQNFVSDYVERSFASSPRGYTWNLDDALAVSPAGFFWQGAPRPVEVRVFGEFCIPGPLNASAPRDWTGNWRLHKEGGWQGMVGCRPGVPALEPLLSRTYPGYSTQIPDQIRADEFLRELAEREESGKMPNIVVLTLNNNHTNGTRPGSPTPRAMVADNDLALGRIVEGISKSRFWAHSLILAVEDDAQDGLDHVDGHRTVALAVGPHVRRGALDSNHYNHSSMIRTIQEIFRIPPRTRYLRSARAMTSIFTAQPDLTPYEHRPAEIALDEMNQPITGLHGRRLWAARQSLAMNWSEPDDIPQGTLNRILWWDAKGYNTPYPGR